MLKTPRPSTARIARATAAAVTAAVIIVGGSGAAQAQPLPPEGGEATVGAPAGGAARAGESIPITKVLTFVVENHSLRQMKKSMPYVFRLAKRFAYATHYTGVTHPSLPNYLAMVSGSTHRVRDDASPAQHRLSGETIFDQALELGRTATVYVDAMKRNCQLRDSYPYAVKHNPWAYFVDGRASCRKHDVPVSRLHEDVTAGTLPHVGLVIPDLVHDAHDAELGTADAWIKRRLRLVLAGPDWRSGHLAVVVTADEDDYSGDNRVLTVVASRYQDQRVVRRHLDHYSLTRFYESVIGAPFLGEAATAPSMLGPFGIRVAPGT